MRAHIQITPTSHKEFNTDLKALMRNIEQGSKQATEEACKEIMKESYNWCPKDTTALAESGYYIVKKRTDIKGHNRYEAILGYGGTTDPDAVFYGLQMTAIAPSSSGRDRPVTALQMDLGAKARGRSVGWSFMSQAQRANSIQTQLARYASGSKAKGAKRIRAIGKFTNPKSGIPVREYMVKVHEDLSVYHKNGRAKFLEGPLHEYGVENYKRAIIKAVKETVEFGMKWS